MASRPWGGTRIVRRGHIQGLFVANADWGWLLGALVAGGAFLGYVLSRTVGLPGLPAEPDAWLEPLGIASLVAEGVFLMAFAVTRRQSPVVHP